MKALIFIGVVIGGITAWYWGEARVTWKDWRVTVGRLRSARTRFYRDLLRVLLVTAGALVVLAVTIR